jgi:hypothetical protein
MKFKKGDRVRCIKGGTNLLKEGQVYTVARSYASEGETYVNVNGVYTYNNTLAGLFEERFESAENGLERAVKALRDRR